MFSTNRNQIFVRSPQFRNCCHFILGNNPDGGFLRKGLGEHRSWQNLSV